MKKITMFVISLGIVCVFGGVAFGDIIHVPGDQPTIQAGINAANDDDIVLVADETYTGVGNNNLDFEGKAITVQSKNGPENCIIDCEDSGRRGFIFQNEEGPGSVVSGFTIINGKGDGAGILCNSSSPTIMNCNIISNDSHLGTGGIACENASSPTIKDCIIADNHGGYGAGGIACSSGSSPIISDCTISNNTANEGGGIKCVDSSPTINRCIINGNQAGQSDNGGGILTRNSSATFNDCTISNNTASHGGGIEVNGGSPTITNCVISGNEAGTTGGGIEVNNGSPTITNCIISGNKANSSLRGGGGIYIRNASAIITNCTISNNTANEGGGIYCYKQLSQSVPTVTNCIFWEDTPNEIHNSCGNNFTVTYSDVQGGYSGEGNIDGAPLFMDITDPEPANWNLRLRSNSPCIDKGSNYAPGLPINDLDTKPRIIDGDSNELPIADMGAYEYGDICEGDLDGDLDQDGVDLADYSSDNKNFGLFVFAADFARNDCPVFLLAP